MKKELLSWSLIIFTGTELCIYSYTHRPSGMILGALALTIACASLYYAGKCAAYSEIKALRELVKATKKTFTKGK